ncbi:hypothetical protein EDB89DRAFT_1936110 [Lactarius sanguifluus]|nr:hypothetical protein EDB89DRAFT_1936110 [Lactarius sanguifluus]
MVIAVGVIATQLLSPCRPHCTSAHPAVPRHCAGLGLAAGCGCGSLGSTCDGGTGSDNSNDEGDEGDVGERVQKTYGQSW